MYSSKQIGFIARIAPFVQAECIKRGYMFASPILAQASTESFKGQGISGLAEEYHNYFGMKCGSGWKGKSVNLSTKEEYTPGVLTSIKDNFRVYDDTESGVQGYFNFISTKRYANLKTATSPRHYLEIIRAVGYATSTSYFNTCLKRLQDLNLTQYDNFGDVIKTGNPYPEPTKSVRLGTKGNDARWLQFELNNQGYKLIVDGYAGNLTIGALLDFQKKAFNDPKEVDGICGPKTRQKLKEV